MSWEPLFDELTGRYPRAEIERIPGKPFVAHLLDDALAEYRALKNACAVVVTPLMLPIVIEGGDGEDYLHRRLSQDICGLEPERGAWALQLGGEGRMEMEILLYRGGPVFWGLLDRHWAERSVEIIEQFVFAETVTIHRQWEAEAVIALAGPMAPAVLENLLLGRPEWIDAPWGAMTAGELRGVPCRVFRDGRWQVPYYHVCTPLPALPDLVTMLEGKATAAGGGLAGARAHEYFRIEQGVTQLGRDTGEMVNPLEAGLKGALCYTKGCYPGQEVIARMTNIGHPARLLAQLKWPGGTQIDAGTELKDAEGELAGMVTSSAALPGTDAVLGMGYVKWAHREAEQLTASCGDAEIPTEVRTIAH